MKKNIIITILFLFSVSAFTQNKSSDEEKLIKLSNEWMVAAMNRDEKTLNKIVASEFKLAGTDLEIPSLSRKIWMKNTMENLKIDSINYNKIKVDIIDDVAIVQSVFYWSVAFLDSPAKKDTVNLIDTWIRRKQGWQVVSRLVVD